MDIEPVFYDIEKAILKEIDLSIYNFCVGAVAWVSNKNILLAFNKIKHGTSLIINNEYSEVYNKTFQRKLQSWYKGIRCDHPEYRPISGLGNKSATMHNKILLLGTLNKKKFTPKTVITGSANFTSRSQKRNYENIVILRNEEIATQYFDYWQQLYKWSNELE